MRSLSLEFEASPDFCNDYDNFYQDEIKESDLTFWIDPLDGSKGFSTGHTHQLSCNIGVSLKNRPRLGIIHKLFPEFPTEGYSKTYIGVPESGLFTIDCYTYETGETAASKLKYVPPFDCRDGLNTFYFKP